MTGRGTIASSPYLTAVEAAVELRCNEKTIRRMCNRGDLTGLFVAGRWLIREDDLPTSIPRRPAPTGRRRPRHKAGVAGEAVRELEERLAS